MSLQRRRCWTRGSCANFEPENSVSLRASERRWVWKTGAEIAGWPNLAGAAFPPAHGKFEACGSCSTSSLSRFFVVETVHTHTHIPRCFLKKSFQRESMRDRRVSFRSRTERVSRADSVEKSLALKKTVSLIPSVCLLQSKLSIWIIERTSLPWISCFGLDTRRGCTWFCPGVSESFLRKSYGEWKLLSCFADCYRYCYFYLRWSSLGLGTYIKICTYITLAQKYTDAFDSFFN